MNRGGPVSTLPSFGRLAKTFPSFATAGSRIATSSARTAFGLAPVCTTPCCVLFWQQFSAQPSLLAWVGVGQSMPIALIAMPQPDAQGAFETIPIGHVAPASAGYAESTPITAKATILKKAFILETSVSRNQPARPVRAVTSQKAIPGDIHAPTSLPLTRSPAAACLPCASPGWSRSA